MVENNSTIHIAFQSDLVIHNNLMIDTDCRNFELNSNVVLAFDR